MATPVQKRFSSPNFWNAKVNLSALVVAAILVFVCVRFLTLLPEQYYFGFAKMVDPYGSSEFLVTPPSVSPEEYEALLERNGYSEFARFEEPEEGSGVQPIDHDSQQLVITEQIIEAGQFNFWIALCLKMLPPFVVGYFLFFVWKEDAVLAVPTGAALTAFLLCWPVVVLWEQAVFDVWDRQRYLFIVLYVAYIVLYYHLARLGCITSNLTLKAGLVRKGSVRIDWGKIVTSLVTTSVTAGVTWVVTMAIAKA
ncbi:MAG TPA: hypothetical protein VMW70_13770 [Burkholderiales bacterium]|nr:hypothetical protein [Burkholderiales bacterium]